eukprot:m.886798 g.886798  ORF g.886798 m.886798 type:complete len:483 (-) comp23630_c0_seq1:1458-2906(-)
MESYLNPMQPKSGLTGFGHMRWSEEEECRIHTTLDRSLGPEFLAERAGPGGRRLPYVEASKQFALANTTFGFNGWSTSIKDITIDFSEKDKNSFSVGISAIVRVTLKDGCYHEDIGYGEAKNPSRAAAFEKSRKQAVTDATKRALKMFGNSLGQNLGDRHYLTAVKKARHRQQLHREYKVEEMIRPPDLQDIPQQRYQQSRHRGSVAASTATSAASHDRASSPRPDHRAGIHDDNAGHGHSHHYVRTSAQVLVADASIPVPDASGTTPSRPQQVSLGATRTDNFNEIVRRKRRAAQLKRAQQSGKQAAQGHGNGHAASNDIVPQPDTPRPPSTNTSHGGYSRREPPTAPPEPTFPTPVPASTGAVCASSSAHPSHVQRAAGKKKRKAVEVLGDDTGAAFPGGLSQDFDIDDAVLAAAEYDGSTGVAPREDDEPELRGDFWDAAMEHVDEVASTNPSSGACVTLSTGRTPLTSTTNRFGHVVS